MNKRNFYSYFIILHLKHLIHLTPSILKIIIEINK